MIDIDPEAQLVVEETGGAVPLAEGLTVGRGDGCTLRLPDTAVSKLHARVVRSGLSVLVSCQS